MNQELGGVRVGDICGTEEFVVIVVRMANGDYGSLLFIGVFFVILIFIDLSC